MDGDGDFDCFDGAEDHEQRDEGREKKQLGGDHDGLQAKFCRSPRKSFAALADRLILYLFDASIYNRQLDDLSIYFRQIWRFHTPSGRNQE